MLFECKNLIVRSVLAAINFVLVSAMEVLIYWLFPDYCFFLIIKYFEYE